MTTHKSPTSLEFNPSRHEDDAIRLREQRVRWAVLKVAQTFANPPEAISSQATVATQVAEIVPEASSNVLAFPLEQAQRAVDTAYTDAA